MKRSAEALEEGRKQKRIRIAAIRDAETPKETEQRLEQNRLRTTQYRADETEEETEHRRQQDTLWHSETRANESQVETQQRQLRDRQQRAERPERRQTNAIPKVATKTKETLNGSINVQSLSSTIDSIGKMEHPCEHCGAIKFKNELPIMCCGNGKIQLTPFPQPPEEIKKLWEEETPEAKLFRANSRTINNAICLSSICVRQKTFDKYSPSVIFEGRLFHRMGSLLPEEGEKPRFAQVYILDPSQQSTQRIENMNISTKLSPREVTKMKDLLELVQRDVQQHNPYVKDIMQVLEIPEDQLEKGKIIISAKAKPKNAHSRVYNEQVNLNELSIVLNEEAHEKHDFVINLRGGGQSIIHDLNPKAMPLHFTLLFLEGTHGWSTELKHANNPNKRVTAREWFCFHTHVRNTVSDYLFRAGRLFQEWILNAWITCETQN